MKPRSKTKDTTRATVQPAWLRAVPQSFPLPAAHKPCPAQQPMEELSQQVSVLNRKVQMLKNVLFRLLAAEIKAGNIKVDVWRWLDCSQCREELLSLVDDGPGGRKVH